MKDIGDIGDNMFDEGQYKLEIIVNENWVIGVKSGNTFEIKGLGNGFCKMYLNGKYIKTIPYPKDNIIRPEDFTNEKGAGDDYPIIDLKK